MAAYQDYAGLGTPAPGNHFRFTIATGAVTGLTGGNAILCWRWTQPSYYLRIYRVTLEACMTTAFGTAQASDYALFFNRNWSTAPSGGTTVTPFKPNENLVADQGCGVQMQSLSNFSFNLQIATTGALTTGTRTQDTQPLREGFFNIIALGSADVRTAILTDYGNEYPLTFGNNEGLEITVPTTQGATGVVKYYISFEGCVNNIVF